MPNNDFDVIIIGAGLGGLLCGVMLAKEGKKVCILEKNRQIGGCLQTFAFQKKVFDACVHYVGGLREGSGLNKIFSYAGILDKLSLKSLDTRGFDKIIFGEEQVEYPLANRVHFVESLLPFFPNEKNALQEYLRKISEVVSHFPLYNLRSGEASEKDAVVGLDLMQVLRGLTSNERLVKVLAGNNFLYAGIDGQTPFYAHALSMDGFLHSADKVLPGSSQIAKFLWKELVTHGGQILRNSEVKQLEEVEGKIIWAMTADGQKWQAKTFISAVPTSVLLSLTDSKAFRPAFRERVKTMPHTPAAVMLNLVLKPATVAYPRRNIYWHPSGNVFGKESESGMVWPDTQAFFYNEDEQNPGCAESLSILTYAEGGSFSAWEDSLNITGIHAKRNEAYECQKEEVMDKVLAKTFSRFPELKSAIVAKSMASPLSFRDYTGTPHGSLYGPIKDVRFPAQTQIGLRTKISNLFLTGQNVNLHGVMGVSITAVATCAELLGMQYLLAKINRAS
ncbi:MAG: FAD-dependent oxidoreductase, partial [Chitinophagaceae bacterium]